MKIHLSTPDSHYFVRRYESVSTNNLANKLTLNNTDYFKTLCLHNDFLMSNLEFKNIQEIPENFFEELSERRPQVLLLGTGNSQVFLAQAKLKAFIEKQIGIESMTTDAAARTYNILAQEGRDVMAIFVL